MVALYKDPRDELILHWGIGKKQAGEWTAPDDKYLPSETKRFGDGKACQTKFIKDASDPNYRSIHIDFNWI